MRHSLYAAMPWIPLPPVGISTWNPYSDSIHQTKYHRKLVGEGTLALFLRWGENVLNVLKTNRIFWKSARRILYGEIFGGSWCQGSKYIRHKTNVYGICLVIGSDTIRIAIKFNRTNKENWGESTEPKTAGLGYLLHCCIVLNFIFWRCWESTGKTAVLTGLGGGGAGGGSLGAAVAMLGLRGNFLATAGPRGVVRFNQIDRNR